MTDRIRAAYDAVAGAYDAEYSDELTRKPIDRLLLNGFIDLAGDAPIADLGCGPGHITRFLTEKHADVIGLDLSPRMVEIARHRVPDAAFVTGSMLHLPIRDGAWSGAIAMYSIIHFTPTERDAACREFARTIRSGGWLLVAFHVDSSEFAAGTVNHVTSWFNEELSLDGYFLAPDEVTRDVETAGFTVMATTIRTPLKDVEYPSRRCYLLAQRN